MTRRRRMNIVQITPGAGGMYCGGCFRDNALVAAWRKLGHNAVMVPLYLPMTLDEEDQSRGTPIFFGGINVYLQQKAALFGRLPQWAHRLLNSPALLKIAAGSAAKTRPEDVGELTLSMLQGEHGRQTRELNDLVVWLKEHFKPDLICLSDALLLGFVRRLKQELNVPITCLLAGEDSFLDSLPEPYRTASWRTAQERAGETDCFLPTSRYYGDVMSERLKLRPDGVKVVYSGINLEGYGSALARPDPPVIGYFARMCKEKGLDTLVEAFVQLKRRGRVPRLKLRVGGGMSPVDEAGLVKPLRERLAAEGLLADVEFCPNLTRAQKLDFYRSISVLSVPALYGEAFGLYLVEAWASGVPVVQPRHAAFPELLELTQGGVLCEAGNATALADALEGLLLDPARAQELGQAGRRAAASHFGIERMAENTLSVFQDLLSERSGARSSPSGTTIGAGTVSSIAPVH